MHSAETAAAAAVGASRCRRRGEEAAAAVHFSEAEGSKSQASYEEDAELNCGDMAALETTRLRSAAVAKFLPFLSSLLRNS